jgi:hypothetical protein
MFETLMREVGEVNGPFGVEGRRARLLNEYPPGLCEFHNPSLFLKKS